MRSKRFLTTVAIGLTAILFLSAGACDGDTPDAQSEESDRQQSNYERLTAEEPALSMDHPMTRQTINFWIETWDEPGKLAYVYLLASNGQMIGYYIFEGLPVSYCASLTPTYRTERPYGGSGQNGHIVPAPAMDGVYYSGNQCDGYYGKDAVSGAYWEYTIGNGITHLVSSEPLPRQEVEPLGVATIETVDAGN